MRKLKFHEQKLLKKTNFLEYKREGGHREALVTQRYGLVERDDYKKWVFFFFSHSLLLACLISPVVYVESVVGLLYVDV